MPPIDPRQLADLHALLEDWAQLWRVPLLAKEVGIRASGRLRRALGTYRPSTAQITLATWLLEPPHRALLEEVLCHEAAHAAVHLAHAEGLDPVEPALRSTPDARSESAPASARTPWSRLRARLSGARRTAHEPAPRARTRRRKRARPRPRPHGPEWRAYMEAAGRVPRVRFPETAMPPAVREAIAASRRWEHRCPVCETSRLARQRVTRWRCRRCVEAGRSGRLSIERKADH